MCRCIYGREYPQEGKNMTNTMPRIHGMPAIAGTSALKITTTTAKITAEAKEQGRKFLTGVLTKGGKLIEAWLVASDGPKIIEFINKIISENKSPEIDNLIDQKIKAIHDEYQKMTDEEIIAKAKQKTLAIAEGGANKTWVEKNRTKEGHILIIEQFTTPHNGATCAYHQIKTSLLKINGSIEMINIGRKKEDNIQNIQNELETIYLLFKAAEIAGREYPDLVAMNIDKLKKPNKTIYF